MFHFNTQRTLEKAAATATIHRLETERDHARLILAELVRAIETAPQSAYADPASYRSGARRAFAEGQEAIRVEAPHRTWRPLTLALEKAHRILGAR